MIRRVASGPLGDFHLQNVFISLWSSEPVKTLDSRRVTLGGVGGFPLLLLIDQILIERLNPVSQDVADLERSQTTRLHLVKQMLLADVEIRSGFS